MEILVTSYSNPDLDGVACTFAYAEFLRKKGKKTKGGLFGEPDEEAKFVLDKLDCEVESARKVIEDVDEIVLVDASNLEWMTDGINRSKISEVIDHREHNLADSFEAVSQIELVGAAATLVAERFRDSDIDISYESAELLYAAIADNTVNFQANVTTERDKDAAKWLVDEANLQEDVKEDVFRVKSEVDRSVSEVVEDDYYNTVLADSKVGVAQIEMLEARNFIEKNLEEIISKLTSLAQEESLDYVFLTSADASVGINVFVAEDKSAELLENALDINFDSFTAEDSRMLLRKEIIPKVKEELEG